MRKLVEMKKGELAELGTQNRIAVEQGSLWVTFEGDTGDYFFLPGDSVEVRGGKMVAEALECSIVVLTGPEQKAS